LAPLLLVDTLIGLALVAAIAASARRPPVSTSPMRRRVGWALVAGPLPAAVAVQLLRPLPAGLDQAAFIAGVVAFAVGAVLVLAREDRDHESGSSGEPEPPWWPDFERDFRVYASRRAPVRLRR
jgi:hypothetical protein